MFKSDLLDIRGNKNHSQLPQTDDNDDYVRTRNENSNDTGGRKMARDGIRARAAEDVE